MDKETNESCSSSKPHFIFLVIVSIIVCLLVPKVMEGISALTNVTTSTAAYEGDGIVLGDSGTVFPFLNIHWTITQQLMFQDTFHAVSIYAVPWKVARRHIFPYRSIFSANSTVQVQKEDIHSVGQRIYIYFLSKEYLNHGQMPSAKINVEVLAEGESEVLTAPVFQFQSRETFSNFIDLEPGAVDGAVGCNCMLGDAIKENCKKNDRDCIERLRIKSGCPSFDFCSPDGVFTPQTSSYNFFTTDVPENSTVRYDADLLMYFYNATSPAFDKYYICTIRGTDSCSFPTKGFFKLSKSWKTRKIIIAYTHPATVPSAPNTHLIINAVIKIDKSFMMIVLCVLIAYLILRHCFHFFDCLRRKKVD